MKRKPLSIRHRFVLLQVSAFALVIWLVAGAVYVNLKIRREMEEPLRNLHAALALNSEIEAAQEEMMMALGRAYLRPGEESRREFQAAVRKLSELAEGYSRVRLSAEESNALETLQQRQTRLVARASKTISLSENEPEVFNRIGDARKVNLQIVSVLHNIAQARLQRLEASMARLREHTRRLYLLLAVFGLFAVLALLQFRRLHRRELWQPLEDLRRMVMEIRQGKLNVRAEVPCSIEFGALVSGFLVMAAELREMRDSLEQEVRERTAKLAAAQRELVRAAKLSSLAQLVSGVAHEINNPLTSILGFSELALARQDLDQRLRTQLQTVRDEAMRLRRLVASLHAFGRRARQRTACVDLRTVLDNLVDLRRYQLHSGNIELHLERPARPVWVAGDRDQLVEAFFNLVLNAEQAIQSCRSGGDIWLACGTEDSRAWATVRDNGSGMSTEVLGRIFDPFFSTKPVGQGAGLGLSISYAIIQQHHGTITAESAEGQGATLRITLPSAEPPKEPSSEPAPGPAEVAGVTKPDGPLPPRALIIDDEQPITLLVEQFLEGRGWQRVVLNDSTAVEATLERQRFGLVICDLKMPRMNGLDVLRLLRRKRPELAGRFLLMTGNLPDTEEKENGELAGVPILRKPFDLAHLAEVLETLLASRG